MECEDWHTSPLYFLIPICDKGENIVCFQTSYMIIGSYNKTSLWKDYTCEVVVHPYYVLFCCDMFWNLNVLRDNLHVTFSDVTSYKLFTKTV